MIVMRRSADYDDLIPQLKGKKVAIWTCNTCARLCNEIGGQKSAEVLAERLSSDGVEITGILSTSASCIMSKVDSKYDEKIIGGCDIVLSLVCDVGSACVEQMFGKPVLNPIETLGTGYLDINGMPILADGSTVMMRVSPFV